MFDFLKKLFTKKHHHNHKHPLEEKMVGRIIQVKSLTMIYHAAEFIPVYTNHFIVKSLVLKESEYTTWDTEVAVYSLTDNMENYFRWHSNDIQNLLNCFENSEDEVSKYVMVNNWTHVKIIS